MTHILDIFAEISELRAELASTVLTRAERTETLQRLDAALTEAERRPEEE